MRSDFNNMRTVPEHSEWKESSFYSIYYKNQDSWEAAPVIDNFLERYQPIAAANMLNISCGLGRYARYLATKGFEVCGIDESENSIQHAKQFEQSNLTFFRHDMLQPFPKTARKFDYVFSLFSNFGHLEEEEAYIEQLKNIASVLHPKGLLLIDYFNARNFLPYLPSQEIKIVDDLVFKVKISQEQQLLWKEINFTHQGQEYKFKESYFLFFKESFEYLLLRAGLRLVTIYGDYQLNPFDEKKSPRMILVIETR